MKFNSELAWLFGLWLGDRSSYKGLSICNKHLPTIRKAFGVLKKIGIDDVESKIYYNSKIRKPKEVKKFLKSLGIKKISFYPSDSCGSYCVYIYNGDKNIKPIFKSMRNNFEKAVDELSSANLYSVLAGIFDAEGSIESTYGHATIEFKTDSVESKILKLLLNELGLEYSATIKNNDMTSFKIGKTLKAKRHLKKFYLNTKSFLSNEDKLNDMRTLAAGNVLFRNHQVLYPLFIKMNPSCSRRDISIAFGRRGREGTRLRVNALLKKRYIRSSLSGREYKYFITKRGKDFIRNNRKLIDEIANACYKNKSWGKGPIYKLTPFILKLKSLGSMPRTVSSVGG